MSENYPLNPVVSSNTVLAENYNRSLASATMMSECLTPHQVLDLINQGRRFDSIVFVNGEGRNLIEKMRAPGERDEARMPKIKSVWLNPHAEEAVEELCSAIGNDLLDSQAPVGELWSIFTFKS
jgi:hypothetical protein